MRFIFSAGAFHRVNNIAPNYRVATEKRFRVRKTVIENDR
jgi:hypothetical protein